MNSTTAIILSYLNHTLTFGLIPMTLNFFWVYNTKMAMNVMLRGLSRIKETCMKAMSLLNTIV